MHTHNILVILLVISLRDVYAAPAQIMTNWETAETNRIPKQINFWKNIPNLPAFHSPGSSDHPNQRSLGNHVTSWLQN